MPPFAINHSWSLNRFQEFNFCQKSYYYSYFQSQDGWQNFASEANQQLYEYKKYTLNTFSIQQIICQKIGFILNSLKSIHDSIDWNFLIREACRELSLKIQDAVHYTDSLDGDLSFQTGKEKITQYLKSFQTSDFLQTFLLQKPQIAYLNHIEKFYIGDLSIKLLIDLCYRKEGKIIFVFWNFLEIDLNERMKIAILFAMKKWNLPIEKINILEYDFCSQTTFSEPNISIEEIFDMQDRILTSSLKMHLSSTQCTPEDFPATTEKSHCKTCKYQTPCIETTN